MIDFLNCGIASPVGLSDETPSPTIPEPWVRASILIRTNSLVRGHSGVRLNVINGLIDLLNNDIVPLIPLRGSISASGDLIPLSYIGGTLQGKRGIKVYATMRQTPSINVQNGQMWDHGLVTPLMTPPVPSSPHTRTGDTNNSDLVTPNGVKNLTKLGEKVTSDFNKQRLRHIVPSCDALADHGLSPLIFAPKEGIALVNGTAVSAASGALAMHDAQGIAILAQILTAMSVEALNGTVESFDPFFGKVRPHPGQIEAASNIKSFLQGSKLVRKGDENADSDPCGLRQDRYALRTASQWIGPQLENLTLAQQQVEIECNSTTDNPLLDVKNGEVRHGGNFQALAITSAMEKVRQSLQQLGRMLFVQCSELINPSLNNGLPPNLEAAEPSLGFLMKGLDISTAALCSELGYLANPMTPHVQLAEMGNQSLNSMAFVSARYTHTALDVISQLAAAHLFALCQALDLRCIQVNFFNELRQKIVVKTANLFSDSTDEATISKLHQKIWAHFQIEYKHTASQDSTDRFHNIFKSSLSIIMSASNLEKEELSFKSLNLWAKTLGEDAALLYKEQIHEYQGRPSAKDYLSPAAYRVWDFVRNDLGVPFHGGQSGFQSARHDYKDVCVGEMPSKIYSAIKDGGLIGVAMACLREAIIGAL